MTLQEHIAYIAQRQNEAREFAAQMRAGSENDTGIPWAAAIGGLVLGATIFGAGMLFGKLL